MKRAFSLVELLFVLIIIAGLISIFSVKMFVTKNDVDVITTAANIKNAIEDIKKYVLIYGKIENNITKITSFIDPKYGWKGVNLKKGIVFKECIKLELNGNDIIISHLTPADNFCSSLQKKVVEEKIKIFGSVLWGEKWNLFPTA